MITSCGLGAQRAAPLHSSLLCSVAILTGFEASEIASVVCLDGFRRVPTSLRENSCERFDMKRVRRVCLLVVLVLIAIFPVFA